MKRSFKTKLRADWGTSWGRGIAWLVALFIVLAVGLFYLKQPPKALPLILQGEASEIVLTVAGQSTHMVKVDGRWQLDPPQNMPLDQEVIAGVVIAAKSLKSRRTLAATPEDLRTFGLQSSMNMLLLRSETAQLQMIYGHQTFDGSDIYVRELGRTDVFLVSKERVSQLLKPLAALRDPYLFVVPAADELESIDIQLPGKKQLRMVRHGVFWLIEDAQKKTLYLADKAELDQLISALGSLRVQHFVGVPDLQSGRDLSTFRFEYGGIQRTVSFFRVSGVFFAALQAYPDEVFQVSSEFEDQLQRDWVAKRPFAMDRFVIDTLVLEAVSTTGNARIRQTIYKKPSGVWQQKDQDKTLWVHNFFVHLSALSRVDMGASVGPSRASGRTVQESLGTLPEYALFLRRGDLQSRLDIALTTQKIEGDPLVRIQFMDRTMWVRDPGGQFVAHMMQMLGEK